MQESGLLQNSGVIWGSAKEIEYYCNVIAARIWYWLADSIFRINNRYAIRTSIYQRQSNCNVCSFFFFLTTKDLIVQSINLCINKMNTQISWFQRIHQSPLLNHDVCTCRIKASWLLSKPSLICLFHIFGDLLS